MGKIHKFNQFVNEAKDKNHPWDMTEEESIKADNPEKVEGTEEIDTCIHCDGRIDELSPGQKNYYCPTCNCMEYIDDDGQPVTVKIFKSDKSVDVRSSGKKDAYSSAFKNKE